MDSQDSSGAPGRGESPLRGAGQRAGAFPSAVAAGISKHPGVALAVIVVLAVVVIYLVLQSRGIVGGGGSPKKKKRKADVAKGGGAADDDGDDSEVDDLIAQINDE